MSNILTQGGLRLYQPAYGFAEATETCIALSGDSTRIGIGDPVKISAAGATSTGNGKTVMAVTRAAGTTDQCYGVCIGVLPNISGTGDVSFGTRYRKASTAQYILVRPANNQDTYEICDDGSAALTKANIGNNAKLVAADCDTASGQSKFMIDATNVASGNATYFVHIKGVVDDGVNDPSSANARWLVTLNNVYRSGGTGTVGV